MLNLFGVVVITYFPMPVVSSLARAKKWWGDRSMDPPTTTE